ncbi:MAG TPA: WD40 repeat domain-containing protein [Herpetosiphonaceae bacterium]
MKQWLNGLVALCVALLLGGTIFIASQNPPPTEVRRPDPSPTVTPQPTATPAQPTPQNLTGFPSSQQGMIMATQPDGTLRLFAGGDRSWQLDLQAQIVYATWSPDGRHIVAATTDGAAFVTHPERQDSLSLLSGQQRLSSPMLSWKDPITVALAYEDERAPSTVALWSYRSGELTPIGSGRDPAAVNNGPVAWVALDRRSIVLKRDDAAPEILVSPQQLDDLFPSRQPDTTVEIMQLMSPSLVWSLSGSELAFVVTTRSPNAILDWSIAVVSLDGSLKHWLLPSDSAVYQLGWYMDRLLFSDDHGINVIDRDADAPRLLLPQSPPARYFAISPLHNSMLQSLPDGLYTTPISNLELPQASMERFGPSAQDYQPIERCCLTVPRQEFEP